MELVSSYKWTDGSGDNINTIISWILADANTPILHKWYQISDWSGISLKALTKISSPIYSMGFGDTRNKDSRQSWFFGLKDIPVNNYNEMSSARILILNKGGSYKEYTSDLYDIIQVHCSGDEGSSNNYNGTFTIVLRDDIHYVIYKNETSDNYKPLYGAYVIKDGTISEENLTTPLPAYISAAKTLDKGINSQCIATPIVVENLKTPLYRIIFNNTTFEIGDTIAVDGQRFFMIDENIGVIA